MATPHFADTDWDWFFSSLAQSAAAIVAIFAGFIINKILANQAASLVVADEMTRLKTEAEHLRDDAEALPVEWYTKYWNKREFDDAVALLDDPDKAPEGGWTLDALIEQIQLSEFQSDENNRADAKEFFDQHMADLREQEENSQVRSSLFGNTIFGGSGFELPKITTMADIDHFKSLVAERNRIEALHRKIRNHMRVIADTLATAERTASGTGPIRTWLALVTCLFVVGVVYPLSFLPAPHPPMLTLSPSALGAFWFSTRGALLAMVTIAFCAVTSVFFRINAQTGKQPAVTGALRDASLPQAYGDVFAIVESRKTTAQGDTQPD